MDNFTEVFLYTNQSALKRYMINNEIAPIEDEFQSNYTLSDNMSGGVLYFNKAIAPDEVIKRCCNGSYDVAVVVKVYISNECLATSYDKSGSIHTGKISDFPNAVAYHLENSVPFSNVISITALEKQLVFLQGDTTLYVPSHLISKKPYSPKTVLSNGVVDAIIASLKANDSSGNEVSMFLDDMDEFDLSSVDLSNSIGQEEKNNEYVNLKNKLLAGYLMLIQGNRPLNGKLDATLFSLLGYDCSFEEYIKSSVYPNMPFDLACYLKKPNSLLEQYYYELKSVAQGKEDSGNFYSIVISTLLDYDIKDKAEFKSMLLDRITDWNVRCHVEECLSDLRARDRIAILRNDRDVVLPVYALYMFFDYGFDRINENIAEFGLNGTVCVPILLSLWAIKNGMKSIYEEFKNPEVVYAGEAQVADWQDTSYSLIPVDAFQKINGIKLKPDEMMVGNYRCTYINAKIEYCYCVGKTDDKIQALVEKLRGLLSKTLPFQYVALKEALSKSYALEADITMFAPQIHKQYLTLSKKKTSKKKTSKKTHQASEKPDEEMNLFTMTQEGEIR